MNLATVKTDQIVYDVEDNWIYFDSLSRQRKFHEEKENKQFICFFKKIM